MSVSPAGGLEPPKKRKPRWDKGLPRGSYPEGRRRLPSPAERVVVAARALRMTNMKDLGMVRSEYYRAIDALDAALRDYDKFNREAR